jgi:fimbrial chaperone protein
MRVKIFIIAALIASPAMAAEIKIGNPGRVQADTVMRDSVTLTNSGSEAIVFQSRAMVWSQEAGKDVETQTREVLISPARVEIPAGEKRVVRIARQRPSAGKTLTYRVHFNELPKPFNGSTSQAQILAEYSLPFIFEPASVTPPVLTAKWQGTKIVFNNTGGKAARISGLGPVGAKPWVPGLVGWVLPGASMAFPMKQSAASLTVTVNGVVQTIAVT